LIKEIVKYLECVALLAATVVYVVVLITIYEPGIFGSYEVRVLTNHFGEFWYEIIPLLFLLPFLFKAVLRLIKEL